MSVLLNPYLNFDSNAAEVLDFYKSVFGGELIKTTFGEAQMPVADEHKDLLMHGDLNSEYVHLMAADSAPHHAVTVGDTISLSLSGDDSATLTNYFEALSQGGAITEPLKVAPWGDTFGMVVDKFGINWLVNIVAPTT